jgi:hypothetical protein
MVLAEIVSGLSGIKTALDILKGLKKSGASSGILAEIADLQSALIEVQQGIMAANQTHAADVERIRDLEEEVARLKAWDGEKGRYELKAVYAGATVYARKPDNTEAEPPHWLCANCYQDRKKSFLQVTRRVGGEHLWECPNCNEKLVLDDSISPI